MPSHKVGRSSQHDPAWVQWPLTVAALAVLSWLVAVPVLNVFYEALRNGPGMYWTTLTGDPDTLAALRLTATVAPVAVILNVAFGLAAAWAIARFRFRGRALLTSMIDLPFAVSPVVAGLIFVLIFGLQGLFGEWLRDHGIKILFATPGLILATSFVTFPFVARELIPVMEALGDEEETAAVSLGAGGWTLFRRVTLPNIKWGLLYGTILCNARAMGEFGAVYVVSGHITGRTDTLPLRVEKLFQEYNMPGSFVVASVLCFLAIVTLILKTLLEWKTRADLNAPLGETAALATAAATAGAATAASLAPPRALIFEQGRPLQALNVKLYRPSDEGYGRHGARHGGEAARRDGGHVRHEDEPAREGIAVRDVTKRFGGFVALDGVDLSIPEGSLVALLGPSGSGKTTLLRIIAGLETPDCGTIHYSEEEATHRAPRERNVGFVFQHYALFRHMDVFENVAFGLRVRHWSEDRIQQRVRELLELVQLASYEKHAPSQLSGGQRQRVALARALAPDPKLLLLDEPFGALDARVRKELRAWLRRLHDEIGLTSVLVTHDHEEAFEVSDRVVLMNHGRIVQQGSPEEIFEQPASPFVLDFLGNVNVFEGRVEGDRALLRGLDVEYRDQKHASSKPAKAYARPHELEIDRIPHGGSCLKARVVRSTRAGAVVRVDLHAEEFGMSVVVEVGEERWSHLGVDRGDAVYVYPKRLRVFVHDYQI